MLIPILSPIIVRIFLHVASHAPAINHIARMVGY